MYVGCITNYSKLICFWFKKQFYKKPIKTSHNFRGVLGININNKYETHCGGA